MCKDLKRSTVKTDYKTLVKLKEWYPEGNWSDVTQGQILKAFTYNGSYDPNRILTLVPKTSRRVYAKVLMQHLSQSDFDWELFHNSYL